jgi:hypothetical protein
MEHLDCLSWEEVAILAVFKSHRIRFGFGLTYSTFLHELHARPEIDVRAVLTGLVQRGLLKVLPEVKDFYILTRSGEVLSGPPSPAGVAGQVRAS